MAMTEQLVVYPVKDIEKAKQLFTKLLGTEPYVDSPYYVGYRTEGREDRARPERLQQWPDRLLGNSGHHWHHRRASFCGVAGHQRRK